MEMNDLNERTLTIERLFDAPIDLVWKAWTQENHIAKWWGPKGMKVNIIEHEFKVGGAWKYTMPMPDGSEFISQGKYLEIEEKAKIVTTADFKPMTEGVELHMLFDEMGGKTRFIFKCIHATVEYCQQQERMGFYNGWGSALDRLADSLESANTVFSG